MAAIRATTALRMPRIVAPVSVISHRNSDAGRVRRPISDQCKFSMKAWPLEKSVAVAGGHARLEGATVAVDGQRHLDPGLAQRPHLAEKAGQVADLGVGHRQYDVASAQVGAP